MIESLIYAHLRKSQLLDAKALSNLKIEPLSSGTNQVFRITSGKQQYVIKIPKAPTYSLINRQHVYQASQITAKVGINIPFCYFDLDSGINITIYQPDSQTLNPKLLQNCCEHSISYPTGLPARLIFFLY